MLNALFDLALVLRLLVASATPLMPGAFRFNPSESIEAHRAHSVRSSEHVTAEPALPTRTAVTDAGTPRLELRVRRTDDVRAPRFRPLLTRHTSDRSPEAPEDH